MNIVILNTGCANLFSLKWAIERLGYTPKVSHDLDVAFHADKLFLPGVGTAQAAMKQLKERNLINLIKSYNRPLLGICLGMQLLGSTSDENNGISTLNIIDKPVFLMNTQGLPLPHMGWNQIIIKTGNYLFRNIPNRSYFYFVHSYFMEVNANTIATCRYGLAFTAALQYENFFGVQFHPERSGKNGAQLLKNFLEIE